MMSTTLGEHRADARTVDDSGQDAGPLQWRAQQAQDIHGQIVTLRRLRKRRVGRRDNPDDLGQCPRPEPVSPVIDRHRDGRQSQAVELGHFCAGYRAGPITLCRTGLHRGREFFRDCDDFGVGPGSPGTRHGQERRSASSPRSARMGTTPSPNEKASSRCG